MKKIIFIFMTASIIWGCSPKVEEFPATYNATYICAMETIGEYEGVLIHLKEDQTITFEFPDGRKITNTYSHVSAWLFVEREDGGVKRKMAIFPDILIRFRSTVSDKSILEMDRSHYDGVRLPNIWCDRTD